MVIKTRRLKNKLKLLSVTDKDSQSATIMVLVRVGSRFESDDIAGLAHFVEHTFFKGTEKRPTSKIIGMAIENLGGTSNAFTSQDYTGYYIKVPKEKFEAALEILADIIKNSVFEENEINKERGVIIEEIRMYEDMPMRKAPEVFDEKLFSDHPLGRMITGTVESVSNMKRRSFLDFIRDYYVGENMMVVVAGGIGNEKALTQAEEFFGDLGKGKYASFRKYKERAVKREIYVQNKKVEQTHLVLGGLGYSRKHRDRFIYTVGNAILSEGFGSRLFQVIRDELGLAYYVYSSLDMLDETGSFKIGLGVDNNRAEKAVEAVMEQLRQLKEGKFDDEELMRAKNYLIGNLVTDLETTDDLAIWHGIQDLLIGEVLTVEKIKKKYLKVTREDIKRVWSDILNNENLMLVGISPREDLAKKLGKVMIL